MGELEKVEAQNAVHNWQYTDETRAKIRCTCARCKLFPDGDSEGRTLSIGQQIGETEYKTASTSITGEKSGVSQAIINGKLTASNYGTNGSQTLALNGEETKWVVFGYEDKDRDGLNEVLLLTTEKPTENVIYFYGADAYNNAVEEVNRMCKELYGTNARGMTIGDVDRALGYTPNGGICFDASGIAETIGNFTTKLKDYAYAWRAIENEIGSGKYYDPSHPEGINDNGAALGEYLLDGYWYYLTPGRRPSLSSTVADNTKAMVFGSDGVYCYWLASRGVSAAVGYAYFGTGYVDYSQASARLVLVQCQWRFARTRLLFAPTSFSNI